MSTHFTEFLSAAEFMFLCGTQIDLRNAISRAYYSMYHAARLVGERYPDPNRGIGMGEHERLCKRFIHAKGDRKAVAVGYVLQSAKTARRRADYDLSASVTHEEACDVMEDARSFASKLALCSLYDDEDGVVAPTPGSTLS